jgi:hypothetical protein
MIKEDTENSDKEIVNLIVERENSNLVDIDKISPIPERQTLTH